MTKPTAAEIADLIERFLDDHSLYPQEWNDFVDCKHPEPDLDVYRKRCAQLDPLVNSPATPDHQAITALRKKIEGLRRLDQLD